MKGTILKEPNIVLKFHQGNKSEFESAINVSKPRLTVLSSEAVIKMPQFLSKARRRLVNTIIGEVKANPNISSTKLTPNVKGILSVQLSTQTVRNVLKTSDYHGRVARK